MKKNLFSAVLCFVISFSLFAQNEVGLYGLNRTQPSFDYYFGKIDLNNGQISNVSGVIPAFNQVVSSMHYPAIDPVGNRYFIIALDKLYSIDINTGLVLQTFNINSYEDLWTMQYNVMDNSLYCINRTSNPFQYFLGKIDLTTGAITSYPTALPAGCGPVGSAFSPTLDPVGGRYFIVSSKKLWIIDLNTGLVINSFSVTGNGYNNGWSMQYNFKDSTLYCINRKMNPLQYYLGKIDLNTGLVTDFPNALPSTMNGIGGSTYTPAIDPIDSRYFITSSQKLWSIDLNTGLAIDSFSLAGQGDLWYMQYNYKDTIVEDSIVNDTIIDGPQPNNMGSVNIYPNPTNSFVTVSSTELFYSDIEMKLLDMQGNVLIEKYISVNKDRIDISNLPVGVYILEIMENNHKRIEKIIKY